MNLYGSYKKLLGNSISAISAAIEIYNKPKMDYRDETFVVLLVNGWELVLKALLSKNKQKIFYKKKRNEPYRTYSISSALKHTQLLFPSSIDYEATSANLNLLIKFRDNIIHYYNEPGMSINIYLLAQTSIVNYRDLLKKAFNYDLSKEITLALLPLALSAPIDPIEFVNIRAGDASSSREVREFCNALKQTVIDLENTCNDTARLITYFKVNLQSEKKIKSSDFVIGIDGKATGKPVYVNKFITPNESHPLRRMDIITSRSKPDEEPGMKLTVGGNLLTSHIFDKIVKHYKIKQQEKYCWKEENGYITKYSYTFVDFLKKLSKEEVEAAISHKTSKDIKEGMVA